MHHTAESRDSKKRTLGVLVASRWPVALLERAEALVPWPEKVLSATVATPNGSLELHAVHVPNGSANQWVKIETLQGIAKLLSCSSAVPRILCGDFNTPKHELPDGRIVTWAQDLQLDGTIRTQKYRKGRAADEWDEGERAVLLGLSGWDLPDVFRQLHGYEVQGHSWVFRGKGTERLRRFDHVFASKALDARECRYVHELREGSLSDHSPIEVVFGC